MAYLLSLSSNSPLAGLLEDEPNVRSSCSIASIRTNGTDQHKRLRSLSSSSFSSAGSQFFSAAFRRRNLGPDEHSPNVRSASTINLGLNRTIGHLDRQSASANNSRRTSLASSNGRRISDLILSSDHPKLVTEITPRHEGLRVPLPSSSPCSTLESDRRDADEGDTTLQHDESDVQHTDADTDEVSPINSPACEAPAFSNWISKLRKRRQHHVPSTSPRKERWTLDDFDDRLASPTKPFRYSAHHKSDSQNSSLKFITSVRSATATLASASMATISRQWRRGHQRSSIMSGSDPRPSVDSARSIIDEAAKQRAKKRRVKLEELIRTEESYVADVKALSNAYCTILPHQHTATSFTRATAQKIIADILHLHDDILSQLHRAVPFAEYDQSTANITYPDKLAPETHNRWHSIDGVPMHITPKRAVLATIRQGRRSLNLSRSDEHDETPLRCSPPTVAAAARIFMDHLLRFAIYEEFGANYDLVQRDIDDSQRNTANWLDYDRAIEALSAHINSLRRQEANQKKAMSLKDLLIKPIQRLPRYELLFADLAKLTPVCDDPDAHTAIEELCESLSEIPKSVFLRLLGPVSLCGCLHIAFRGRDRIRGLYVICILFETHLVLALADDDHPAYRVLASVILAHATLEETDNQKGLQCHTAPHSWKVVFEHSGKMYELIASACSSGEAEAWRTHISAGIGRQSQAEVEGKLNILPLSSPLAAEMRSVGKAFGKPSSFVRKMSVHRAATVGPTSDLNQVIIKNTQAVKEAQDNGSQSSLQIPRSQSVQTPSHIQTLAPRRADRQRLETILADVWSKDLIPYPGMIRRSDPIRASANHVIRKFSMASITSNFSSSKRTPSYTSVNSWRKEELVTSKASVGSRNDSLMTATSRHVQPTPVNFHTAPDAFLPADFDIQDPVKAKKKSAFRTFTLTMERPFSPLGNETKSSTLRRAQSVKDAIDCSSPTRSPTPLSTPLENQKPEPAREPPVYSVVQEQGACPPLQTQTSRPSAETLPAKTQKNSKSRLLRIFH